MKLYEVAVCQCREWDWQMSISYHFESLLEATSFVQLSLENDLLVQIMKVEED